MSEFLPYGSRACCPRSIRRRWRVLLGLVIATAFTTVAVLGYNYSQRRLVQDEAIGFYQLRALSRSMIAENAPGVTNRSGEGFVLSFPAFFDYVAKHRPGAVSTADAGNPFPGLLPGRRYGRLRSTAGNGSEPLLWSEPTYDFGSPLGRRRLVLRCDGLQVDAPEPP